MTTTTRKISKLPTVGEKYFLLNGEKDPFDYKASGEFVAMVDVLPFEIWDVWGTFVVLDADIWTAITGRTNPVKGDKVYLLNKDNSTFARANEQAYEIDRLEFNPEGTFSFDQHVADTIADERNATSRPENLVFRTSFETHQTHESFGFEVPILIGNDKTLSDDLTINTRAYVVNIDALGPEWLKPGKLISLSHSFY